MSFKKRHAGLLSVGSLFDIFPVKRKVTIGSLRADWKSISSDWQHVGKEINIAAKKEPKTK